VWNGDYTKIKLLLTFGANPNKPLRYGSTSLHHAADLCEADDGEIISILLGAGASLNIENDGGWTPLQLAVDSYRSNTKIVDFLLKSGADPKKETQGKTPLSLVISNPHSSVDKAKIVSLLLNAGANPKLDRNRDSLLGIATVNLDFDSILFLLKTGALDPNELNKKDKSPLHYAVSNDCSIKNTRIITCLLEAGADPRKKNKKGVSPLELAISLGKSELVTLFLANKN